MASVQVRVLDVSGSRICDVEAPDDVTVDRILVLMVEKMGLPLNSPDGQLMSYKLHHRRTGTQLLDNQTLLGAGVRAGDELADYESSYRASWVCQDLRRVRNVKPLWARFGTLMGVPLGALDM